MSANDKDEDMIYGLTADERDLLQSGLKRLPETMPPRAVWERIREQGEAEGLLHKSAATHSWYLPSGLAAAVVTAVILRAIPAEPRVVRAGTAATIADIQDRIAAIDYQLSDPDVTLSPEEEKIFWRERVRLMKSLVGLRYAQAQRNAL